MNRQLQVPAEAVGQRADAFVATALPQFSRATWQKQFTSGNISQDGKPLKAASRIVAGEINVVLPDTSVPTIALPVIFEDDNVLVINKPTGVLTHAKGELTTEATVADFVQPRTTGFASSNRTGIVHRLDRATSGVLIAAKNPNTAHQLQAQFAQRKTKKTYLALVQGELQPEAAIIRLPIERNPQAPQKFRVGARGKSAETTYKVLRHFANYTLLELTPFTGRTHQLRVHLAHLGHPIAGDGLYGKKGAVQPPRLFLHAASLEITIPGGQRKVFEAPLPSDLTNFLRTLPQ